MNAEESWVEVVPHDDRWAKAYEKEATKIRSTLGDHAREIEHFGSTAVSGLVAKPIVDILIGTPEGEGPEFAIKAFEALGYQYLGEDGRRPGRYFWRKRGVDAFNVSVVPYGGMLWKSNLAVRDFLRTHPDWIKRYGEAKLSAAAVSESSMLEYQDYKREFIDELRAAALSWADVSTADEQ